MQSNRKAQFYVLRIIFFVGKEPAFFSVLVFELYLFHIVHEGEFVIPAKTNRCNFMKLIGYICLLFLATTYFGHSCDHIWDIPQYKYQQYNKNYRKCVIEFYNSCCKGKGKFFPLQALTGPWGFGRIRLPDFLYFRHYEDGKVVTLTHRPSLPSGVSWHSFLEAESTPGHMVPLVATEKKNQRHHWGSVPRPSN
jgi:hypothetical protein